jgi:predicted nucleic acid-binding protein
MNSDHPAIVFLDANVLISAAWKDGAEIAQMWNFDSISLVTSNYVLGEMQRNLHQPSHIERMRILLRSVRVFYFEDLLEFPEALVIPEKDQPILAGAILAGANYLVSGDKRHFGPLFGTMIQGVRITSPPELLAVLRLQLP